MMIEIDEELRLVLIRIALSLESLADSAERIADAAGPPKKAPPKPTPALRRKGRPDPPLPGETTATQTGKPEGEKP